MKKVYGFREQVRNLAPRDLDAEIAEELGEFGFADVGRKLLTEQEAPQVGAKLAVVAGG